MKIYKESFDCKTDAEIFNLSDGIRAQNQINVVFIFHFKSILNNLVVQNL